MLTIPPTADSYLIDVPHHTDPAATARRSNRRRLGVFLTVFASALIAGLVWNLQRPAEYRTAARLQISTGTANARVEAPAAAGAEQPAPRNDLLTQAQILTSRSLLEEVHQRLVKEGRAAGLAGAEPVTALQNMLVASPLAGTDIVELQAIGGAPQLLVHVVNTVVTTYREQLFASHGNASQSAIVNLRDEIQRLDGNIAKKRAQLAVFRVRSGVVSSERTENEALARVRGLSESLNKASEDAAKADARLRTLRESAASGRSPVFARDNPTLAVIEQRISAMREELRDMERNYTPDYMKLDPTARALRARLTELEQQLSASRLSSQQAALATAEEEAAGARVTVERIRVQMDDQRQTALTFSGKFSEAQTMEEDLRRIEGTRRSASERLAQIEASENARRPSLTLLEAASLPGGAWRPDYLRDGLIVLAASFLLGLLAMWFVELFNRAPASPPPGTTTLVLPPHWMASAPSVGAPAPHAALPFDTAYRTVPQLSAKVDFPPPLTQDEVRALLAAAEGQGRLLCAFLLLGLTVDELKVLAFRDIERTTSRLTVRGASARMLPLPDWLARMLDGHAGNDPDKPLFCNALGRPFGATDVATHVTCAALDAGLAASVSPDALRHTYLTNLIRQNVRFSDLRSLAGNLSVQELEAYAAVGSGPRQVRGAAVDPIMPALRELTPGFETRRDI